MSSKDTQLAVLGSSLDQYMAEVNRFPLLSREEEQELAQKLVDDGDVEAAQRLVTANLRFVVKVAYEYRNYNVKLVDLVQEGNIGLMKAVRRFNPDRGYRLISYAVWWIRAYMQNYIIKNWSMVKIGATAANRKMLFGKKDPLREDNEKRETFLVPAMSTLSATDAPDPAASIARKDFHLDASMDDEGGGSYTEMLADRSWEDPDEEISRSQTIEFVSERLEEALELFGLIHLLAHLVKLLLHLVELGHLGVDGFLLDSSFLLLVNDLLLGSSSLGANLQEVDAGAGGL